MEARVLGQRVRDDGFRATMTMTMSWREQADRRILAGSPAGTSFAGAGDRIGSFTRTFEP